ncbi:hypothetical protein C9374_012577 [Naegleria lovaniensis]|uniref:Dephospho-CoA kinase n=1 Tax=Naegleria lovaniensis TaxID=51637 RepID=A0AA88GZZ7_NAELO|nr:uncharacterized protein C9374_012577 [Naegleria lovaniensis]KAG2392325.1 hypothetical protein C9374_012577 [Naegleria lovaniensis]
MKLVGITGGIACGKTTLTNYLKEYGNTHSSQLNLVIIDSDEIAHTIYSPGSSCYNKVKKFFETYIDPQTGEHVNIFSEDGIGIDRPKLSAAVFKDVKVRKMINAATHMEIFKEIMKRIFIAFAKSILVTPQKTTICFVELPLLFETKIFQYIVSTIVCIKTTPERQLQWLMHRNHYTEEEAQQRISSQIPVEEKAQRSDFVIDNSRDREYLKIQTFDMVDYCGKHTSTFGLKTFVALVALIFIIVIVGMIF